MPKITKNIVDANLRTIVFNTLEMNAHNFTKINDRQYGCLLTDLNGTERYVRIGVIVAEEREDMSASELMGMEVAAYNEKQANKAAKAAERTEKAARDKAAREAKKKEKEEEKEGE